MPIDRGLLFFCQNKKKKILNPKIFLMKYILESVSKVFVKFKIEK